MPKKSKRIVCFGDMVLRRVAYYVACQFSWTKFFITGVACLLFLQGGKSKGKALRSDLAVRLVDFFFFSNEYMKKWSFFLNACDFLLFNHETFQLYES